MGSEKGVVDDDGRMYIYEIIFIYLESGNCKTLQFSRKFTMSEKWKNCCTIFAYAKDSIDF